MKREHSVIQKQLREMLRPGGLPGLFDGWTPEMTMSAIKSSVKSLSDEERKRRLCHNFPLVDFHREQANGNWSYGFCHAVAQMASLVFYSAGLKHEGKYTKDDKKIKTKNVDEKFKKHFVLKLEDGSYFDPAADVDDFLGYPVENYENDEGTYKSFKVIGGKRCPTRAAIKWFKFFLKFCSEMGLFRGNQQIAAKKIIGVL